MNLTGPDGKAVWVDDAWAAKAKAQGFRDATPDEVARAKAAEQPGLAAAEGAARTIAPGIADPFMRGFTGGLGQDPGQVERRKEENPIAAGAGEVAGALAPFGAPGAIARAGEGVAATVASKVASRALRGGLETGLYGLGNAINESAAGDPGLTGEHVAAETLGSTLLGAGAGVVLGKFGDIGKSALVKAFGGRALKDTLDAAAEKAFAHAIGMKPSDLGRMATRGNFSEIMRFGIDEGLGAGLPTTATVAERAAARVSQAGDEIGQQLASADTLGTYDPMRSAAKMQDTLDKLEGNPAAKAIRSHLQEVIDGFVPQAPSSQPVSGLDEAPRTFAQAWQTSSTLLEKVGPTEAKGLKSALLKMRGALQEDIFAQAKALDPKLGDALEASNRDYYLGSRIKEMSTKAADQVEANRGKVGLYDALAAGAGLLHSGPLGIAAGVAAHAVKAVAQDRGGFALSSALDAMAKSGVLNKIANGFQGTVRARLANPSFGGAFRPMIENALAQGAETLLDLHMRLWPNPDYRAAVGMDPEDPSTFADYADKAHRLGTLSNTVQEANQSIDKSLGRMFGEQGGRMPGPPAPRAPTLAEYTKLMAKLQILTKADHTIHNNLSQIAPTSAGLAAAGIAQGAQYLLAKAPKNPFAGVPPSLQQPWAPSKSEMRTWYRCVDAVADPRGVLEAMRRGDATPEAIEALKAVYPKMAEEFRSRLSTRLADRQTPVSRKLRGQIGVLMGNIDDPQVTQLIQQTHKAAKTPTAATGSGSPDGRQKIDQTKLGATQAQQLEEK